MRTKDAAIRTGVSERQIRYWCEIGLIPGQPKDCGGPGMGNERIWTETDLAVVLAIKKDKPAALGGRNQAGMLSIEPFVQFVGKVLVEPDDPHDEFYVEFIERAWQRIGRYKSPKQFTKAVRRFCRQSNRIHIDLADDFVTALGSHPSSLWGDEYYRVAAEWDTPILEAQNSVQEVA